MAVSVDVSDMILGTKGSKNLCDLRKILVKFDGFTCGSCSCSTIDDL